MIFFTIICAIFMAFAIFYDNLGSQTKISLKSWALFFFTHFVFFALLYWGLSFVFYYKATMFITGFLLLVSGFKLLAIWGFDPFKVLPAPNFSGWQTGKYHYVFYFSFVFALVQLLPTMTFADGLGWILIFNLLLASFLPLLFKWREAIVRHAWVEHLVFVEAGVFLVAIGLIIMGENSVFFIRGIEKILHI